MPEAVILGPRKPPPPEATNASWQGEDLSRAAEAMIDGLLVYDNFAVYALAGNARRKDLQEGICGVKGDARGTHQPVGWTRPFDERTLSTFDISEIENPSVRDLLRNPEELTFLLGGLAFIRGRADMKAKSSADVPDCVIPEDSQTVQIWSPEGIRNTHQLIETALEKGAEPVMTSANISGQPETITQKGAVAFAERSPEPLFVVTQHNDEQKPDRPRGSYPILEVTRQGFSIVRAGCLSPGIFQAILGDYLLGLDPNFQRSKYPDNVLRLEDLPGEVQKLRGPELRIAVLQALQKSKETA